MTYYVQLPGDDRIFSGWYDKKLGKVVFTSKEIEPVPVRFGQSVSGAILEKYPTAKVLL
jgi:hypothetical protein